MDSFPIFLLIFIVMVITDNIVPKIVKKKPIVKRSISVIMLAIGIALMMSGAIDETFKKQLPPQTFYIEMASLIGYFLYSGLKNKKEIPKKIQFSYYYSLGYFTSIFIVLVVATYWLLPFSKFVS